MPHEIRMTLRASVRLDALNLAEVAKLYGEFQKLQDAVAGLAKDAGIVMDGDPPKLVTVRAREPEAEPVTPVDGPGTGTVGVVLPQNDVYRDERGDLEIPPMLRRQKP